MFVTIVNEDKLKRLISLGQNGKLTSSGSFNCPDTDGAQPVERADLPRLFSRMHGTRKPRISVPMSRDKAKPQGTLIECRLENAEEANAIL